MGSYEERERRVSRDYGAIGTPRVPRQDAPTPSTRDIFSSPATALFSSGAPSAGTGMSSIDRTASGIFHRQNLRADLAWNPLNTPSQRPFDGSMSTAGLARQVSGPSSPAGQSALSVRANTPETIATLDEAEDQFFSHVRRRLYDVKQSTHQLQPAYPPVLPQRTQSIHNPIDYRERWKAIGDLRGKGNAAAHTDTRFAEEAADLPMAPGTGTQFPPLMFASSSGRQPATPQMPHDNISSHDMEQHSRQAIPTYYDRMMRQACPSYQSLTSARILAPPAVEGITADMSGLGLTAVRPMGPPPSDRVFHPMESTARAQQQQHHHHHYHHSTKQEGGSTRGVGAFEEAGTVQPTPEAITRIMAGFSPNYRGNIAIERNRSASIPEHENCSLFILGLPPSLTTRELLAGIRGVGRVYATHINRPEPSRGHLTCAAKIIFFEREPAARFHAMCNAGGAGGFVVGGMRARVVWNRIRTAAQPAGPWAQQGLQGLGGDAAAAAAAVARAGRHRSRVLLIYGPARFVNLDSLTAYFESKLDFQIDQAFPHSVSGPGPDDMVLFEYRFGSFRCQAEAAKMALAREFPDTVKVWFGADPCDVAPPPSPPRLARLPSVEEEDEPPREGGGGLGAGSVPLVVPQNLQVSRSGSVHSGQGIYAVAAAQAGSGRPGGLAALVT